METSEEDFPPLPSVREAAAKFQEEQAMRDTKYLLFEGEDETDYTKGPPRMIFAHDGVEQCSALLMTLDLSQRIQSGIRAQRNFASLQRKAKQAEDANYDFEEKLRVRILRHEWRIEELQEAQNEEELKVIGNELTKLRLLMENTKARRQCIAADIENEAQNWQDAQADINAYFEEALVCANLLEPPVEEEESTVEELTVEKEYEQLCRELQESNGEEAAEIAPLHEFADAEQDQRAPSLSPEEQIAEEIRSEFWSCWHYLEGAQEAFDHREEERAFERQQNVDAEARGETPRDESPEAFDHRWIVKVQELTRRLIHAEEVMAAAKTAAKAAGVDVGEYGQTSKFLDDVEDGYRVSHEREIAASAPVPKITHWLSRVPSEVLSPTFPETPGKTTADDWEGKEIGLSDSASVVAEGPERKRIDKWRTVCDP